MALPTILRRCVLRWRMPRQPMASRYWPVDQPAQRGKSARLVLVDVIERFAGVEARLPAEAHPAAQPAERTHPEALRREGNALGGEQPERTPQGVVLAAGGAALVGGEQFAGAFRRVRKGVVEESRALFEKSPPPALVKHRVREAVENVELFGGRGKPLEKRLLRLPAHHGVRPGGEHEGGRADRAGVGQQAGGGVVQIEQHAHADPARDERIGVVAARFERVVREQSAADVAADAGARPAGCSRRSPGMASGT